jgi:ADP-ribose pyrophosphatase YjhB (NUDIX family)
MSKNRHKMAVAAHLVLTDERGNVLFLRRANTGYADGEWSIPAGHVDPGETLIEACVRETAEELAVQLAENEIRGVLLQHKRDTDNEERLDIFFTAVLPSGQTPRIAEPDKCDGLEWAPIGTPPEPLVAYVDAALKAINSDRTGFLNYFGFGRNEK